jgi:hypothetical protein
MKEKEYKVSYGLKSITIFSPSHTISIAYEEKIREWESAITKLKADITARDDRRINLSKQHVNNRANIDRCVYVCVYA